MLGIISVCESVCLRGAGRGEQCVPGWVCEPVTRPGPSSAASTQRAGSRPGRAPLPDPPLTPPAKGAWQSERRRRHVTAETSARSLGEPSERPPLAQRRTATAERTASAAPSRDAGRVLCSASQPPSQGFGRRRRPPCPAEEIQIVRIISSEHTS